jgi:hypothetical protein
MVLISAIHPWAIETTITEESSRLYQRIARILGWLLRLYHSDGIAEIIDCVKSLCDWIAWYAVESELDEPKLHPSLIGKTKVLRFWFLKGFTHEDPMSKEHLFLIRSWKRSLPKPTPQKVKKTLESFRSLTSEEFHSTLDEHADAFMDRWYSKYFTRKAVPEITLTPSASFECTLKEGGKSVWFSKRFESFIKRDDIAEQIRRGTRWSKEPVVDPQGQTPLKDWGLSFLFYQLRLEGYLPGDPEEFAWVLYNPHEKISGILDRQLPPKGDVPLYKSKVVTILERGWKCRVVTTAPAVVTTALQLLRVVIYKFLEEDHYCLILCKRYGYKSLGAWKRAHPIWWERISKDPRGLRFLSTDLTSATDTFARSLVETLTRRFFGNFTREFPEYRYLDHLIGFVFCPQSYILPDKTEFVGLRGTPMGNPANWAFLEIINEFALAMAQTAYYSQGSLMGGIPLPEEVEDLTVPAVFCGDDNLTMFHDGKLFRLYESYMGLCGGSISSGSHFESSRVAFFTEIPYDKNLDYIEVPKLRMLIEHENNLPEGKFENPQFYRGETVSKAVTYLEGPLAPMREGILSWALLRNFHIIKELNFLGISVHIPRQFGGWGFTSPTGIQSIPHLHKRALKVLLRDDKSLKFVTYKARLGSIWNCTLSDGKYFEILDIIEVTLQKVESYFKPMTTLCEEFGIPEVAYGDFRGLIQTKRRLEDEGYLNTFSCIEVLSSRLLASTWALKCAPPEGRQRTLRDAGKMLREILVKICSEHEREYKYGPLRVDDSCTLSSNLTTRFFFKECALWLPTKVIDFLSQALVGYLQGLKLSKVNEGRKIGWFHIMTMLRVSERLAEATLTTPTRVGI